MGLAEETSADAGPTSDIRGAVLFRDGTDGERVRQAAARMREDLRRMIETSPDGMAVSRQGRLIFANRVMASLLGYAGVDELVGLRDEDLLHPDDAEAAAAHHRRQDAANSEVPRAVELRYRRKDGAYVVLDVSSSRLDEYDGARAILSVARDVTERKRLQMQLLVSEHMASVGTLAAGIAHEFNNPLASMLVNLHLALDHLEGVARAVGLADNAPLAEVIDCVRDASEAGDRLRSIARDIKLFSRVDDRPHGPVDLRRVLDSSARIVMNEVRHRARLVKSYGERLPHVAAVEARLGQVFLNLLVNAAQSIPEGNAKGNEVRITAFDDRRGSAIVEISDTGAGIAAPVLARIFDPFFTTKPPGVGTGLGLSICRRIVGDLGGRIEVESTEGVGSVFRVVLPVSESAIDAFPLRPTVHRPLRHGRVLVVDDDPSMGHAVRRILGPSHEVVVSTDPEEALARVQAAERFDVVLCDLMMPDIGGPAFFEALKGMAPSLAERVVFLTGGAFTDSTREFLRSVPNERVEKPFDAGSLHRAVARHVR